MKNRRVKEPVRIREKKLANGNVSLYLDIYVNGQRHYEFLKLYLLPGNDAGTRRQNQSTMATANAVKALRIVEIQNSAHGFTPKNSRVSVLDYAEKVTLTKSQSSRGQKGTWLSFFKMLREYEQRPNFSFEQIDRKWIEGFGKFLVELTDTQPNESEGAKDVRRLKHNTCVVYFSKLVTILRMAVEDGLLDKVPNYKTLGALKESHRAFLTLDELNMMHRTPCSKVNESTRRAFLFSCLTGLRYSDVYALKWGNVSQSNGLCRITFRQQKTSELQYLDISPQAEALMGERGESGEEDYVFGKMPNVGTVTRQLNEWAKAAKIEKHVTFHVARHTFATLMLTLGTDLYTVSKLLGHRNVSTTQIYAKVIDQAKREAVLRIPELK
ncbi:MAG: site-specific integrase [Bacteroidales bacterium]|nr:site-specific integrase [Bacteroidales bacterium]